MMNEGDIKKIAVKPINRTLGIEKPEFIVVLFNK